MKGKFKKLFSLLLAVVILAVILMAAPMSAGAMLGGAFARQYSVAQIRPAITSLGAPALAPVKVTALTNQGAGAPKASVQNGTTGNENQTYFNLYASVQGETNAAASYRAFAAKALEEGYTEIAILYTATADAEAKHAEDEWAILEGMGATVRPVADPVIVGTTAQNLQASFEGETYEYTVMYPEFLAKAQEEGMADAARIFNYAMRAEQVHAGNYADVLANLSDSEYIQAKYGVVYRCPVCGEVVAALPNRCPICGTAGTAFATYNKTYFNLYASVQGETNAAASYRAFAAKALEEGYPVIYVLYTATADAEAKHAEDEWAVLKGMGATERPVAETPTVGTTAQNLQASFEGETYEYTIMYPDFWATAQAEGMTDAARIFSFARRAEEVHAGNFADVLANLSNQTYIQAKYGVVYRCPVCGEVVTTLPTRCPICGTDGALFAMYNMTYFNLYASVQGETNAEASYRAFAAKALEEGYPEIYVLYSATADAEAKHAEDEWAILQGMGATVRPVAETPTVGTTAQNLQASFEGETYEYTIMYPGFLATARDEGMADAVRIFNFAMRAEQVHAGNYADVLANLSNPGYIQAKYGVVYRCPICGEVVTALPTRCPICGTDGAAFKPYDFMMFKDITPTAYVLKLTGNKNELTITILGRFNGVQYKLISKTFLIDNNAAGTYQVGIFKVYVNTKGNVDIRECYIIW